MKLHFRANLFIALGLIFFALPAQAQSVTIDQPIDFGRFVLTDNAAARTIVFNAGGTYTADPEFVFLTTPEFGEVTVTGFPPSTALTVSMGSTGMTGCCVGPNFAMSAPFTRPAIVTTDASGEASFQVGATMTSDGSGVTHMDDTYDGTFSVTVTP